MVALAGGWVFIVHSGSAGSPVVAAPGVRSPTASASGGDAPKSPASPTSPTTASSTPLFAVSGLLESMNTEVGQSGPQAVTFAGSTHDGALTLDITTDGRGGLSGTYSWRGVTGEIVVLGTNMFVRGAAALAVMDNAVTGASASPNPQLTGWYQMPFAADIFAMLTSPSRQLACVKSQEGLELTTSAAYANVMVGTVAATAVTWTPGGGTGLPEEFDIAATGANRLVRWVVPQLNRYEAPSCDGGIVDRGPLGGAVGTYTFSDAGSVSQVTAPSGEQAYPVTGTAP